LSFAPLRQLCRRERVPVHEPLSDHAGQRTACPRLIANIKRDPVIVPEIELGKIAVQVPLATVPIDALHAALDAVDIPPRSILYRDRNAIERMFGRLKDFRRIATRYDRSVTSFLATLCLAANISYWL